MKFKIGDKVYSTKQKSEGVIKGYNEVENTYLFQRNTGEYWHRVSAEAVVKIPKKVKAEK